MQNEVQSRWFFDKGATVKSRDVISDALISEALCYEVPIVHKPLNRLVSDIFSNH